MSNPSDRWTWRCGNCGANVPWQDTHACAAPLPVGGIDTGDIHRRATLAQVQPEIDALKAKLASAEERAARAGETESRLRDEIRDLRLQVQALTEDLEDARRHGCECGEEEACRYVRERDKARAEAARYREALERVSEVLAANGCDCECDHDVESHDDDDCERCVACRVSLALAGQDAGKETE